LRYRRKDGIKPLAGPCCAYERLGRTEESRARKDPKNSKERRGDLRIDVSFPIVVVSPSGRVPAVVENVSLSGALLRTETNLQLQARVDLEIQTIDGAAIHIPAVVVRTTGAQSYGTAFVELSAADTDQLMEFTAQCLKSAAPTPWFLG
jgi:PilZ domain-containing protein